MRFFKAFFTFEIQISVPNLFLTTLLEKYIRQDKSAQPH
jgi:hypothetical protein